VVGNSTIVIWHWLLNLWCFTCTTSTVSDGKHGHCGSTQWKACPYRQTPQF